MPHTTQPTSSPPVLLPLLGSFFIQELEVSRMIVAGP
jgi:hypothetical protein